MTALNYYPAHKNYNPVTVFWEGGSNAKELGEYQNGLGFSMEFKDVDSVRHPVFLVCRDRGMLCLNNHSFVEVNIPDNLLPKLRYCSNIEVVVAYSSTSMTTVYPQVKRVLRFPAYLSAILPAESEAKTEEESTVGGGIATEYGDEITIEGAPGYAIPKLSRTPPRPAFLSWVKDHGGEVVFEYRHGASEFTLAFVDHMPLLVSFFDGDETTWLANEEIFNGEPPLWFAEGSHQQSPLYAIGLAVKYLTSRGCSGVLPLMIMSDHIDIINAEDMKEDWDKLGIGICYCSREDEQFPSLEQCLNIAPLAKPELRKRDAEETEKIRKVLSEFNVEDKN